MPSLSSAAYLILIETDMVIDSEITDRLSAKWVIDKERNTHKAAKTSSGIAIPPRRLPSIFRYSPSVSKRRLQHIVANFTGSAAELSQQNAQRIPVICSTTLPMSARSLDLSSTTFQGGLPARSLSRMNRSRLRLLPLWKAAPST